MKLATILLVFGFITMKPDSQSFEEELQMLFDTLDVKEPKGLLTFEDEIEPILKSEGMDDETIEQIENVVAEVDVQGDGLDFEEFVEAFLAVTETAEGEPTVDDIFNEIDTNGDGSLDKAEVTAVAPELTKEQLDHLWERVDTDKDGGLDLPEFEAALKGGLDLWFDMLDMNLDGSITAEELVEFDILFNMTGDEYSLTPEDAAYQVAYFESEAKCGKKNGAIEKDEFFSVLEGKCPEGTKPEPEKNSDAPECKDMAQGFAYLDDAPADGHISKEECMSKGNDADGCDQVLGFAADPVTGITLPELYTAFGMDFCNENKNGPNGGSPYAQDGPQTKKH